jgi:hypothetical protein
VTLPHAAVREKGVPLEVRLGVSLLPLLSKIDEPLAPSVQVKQIALALR